MGECTVIKYLKTSSNRRAFPRGWSLRREINFARRGLCSQHHFQICGCRLQFELQVRHPGSEKVKRNQSEDGDTETAGRCNQCLGDTPGDGLHREFFVTEKAERSNQTGDRAQQTEQRRQSYECVHDDEESTRAFDLDAGSDLQCPLQRGVLVIEAVPHHAQNWITRSAGKPRGFSRITVLNRGEHFLDAFRITSEPAATPPKNALDHHRERNDRHDENRPHDRAALVKLVDQPVASKEASRFGFRRGRSSWGGARGSGRSGTLCASWCRARHRARRCWLSYCSGLSSSCWLSYRSGLSRRCRLLRCRLSGSRSLPWWKVCSRRLLRGRRICWCPSSRIRACCRRSLCRG